MHGKRGERLWKELYKGRRKYTNRLNAGNSIVRELICDEHFSVFHLQHIECKCLSWCHVTY